MTLNILQEFIDKIVVHHREEIMEETFQEVEVYYKMIGRIEVSRMSELEKASCINNLGRKKRANCLTQSTFSKRRIIELSKTLMFLQHGAEDGIRTRDIQLGKLTLYP